MSRTTVRLQRDAWAQSLGYEDWETAIHLTADLSQPDAADKLRCSHDTIRRSRAELDIPTASPRLTHEMARQDMQSDELDPRHGTKNGYDNLGCRCGRCTAAWATYQRERRNAA